MEDKKFKQSSPMPNWPKPKFLNIKKISNYCEPVNQAIIDWLKRKKETKILKKFLTKWEKLSNKELDIIVAAYSEQTDLILMLSWY